MIRTNSAASAISADSHSDGTWVEVGDFESVGTWEEVGDSEDVGFDCFARGFQ